MKLLMLRLLTISILFTSSLFGLNIEKKLLNFEKRRVSRNHSLKLLDIKIFYQQKLHDNWKAYILDLKLKLLNQNNKIVNFKDILFTNGKEITTELYDLKSYKDYKKIISPKLTFKYYDKKHFIAGNINAKHKLVIFSDPLCPFCIEFVPKTIKEVIKSNNIALYYYHFPLYRLHPAANATTRYMVVAKKQGIKDIELKIYEANLDKDLGIVADSNHILKVLNRLFHTKITLKQLNAQWVSDEIKKDISMGDDVLVKGTPTYFFDDEYDITRQKYKKYLK